MKGLIIKDLYVIGKQLKFFVLAMVVMAVIMDGEIGVFMLLIATSLPITSVAYDDLAGWNKYAVMLPVTRREIVVSKFVLGYIGLAIGMVMVVLGQALRMAFGYGSLINIEFMIIVFAIGLICIAINSAVVTIFGSEKGRYVFILSFAIIGAVFSALDSIFNFDISRIDAVLPGLLVAVSVVANVVLMAVACRFQRLDRR